MTQVKMPEPVGYLYQTGQFRTVDLKLFEDIPYNTTVKGVITTTQAEAYADARVREAQQWISVETLLPPDDGKEVLAIHSDGEVEIVYGHLILETHCDRAYTHWMPIPNHPSVE